MSDETPEKCGVSDERGAAARRGMAVEQGSDANRSIRLWVAAVLLVMAVGVLLRLAGYFGGIELWWDEAMWAVRIERGDLASIRPVGYVWVSRWLIELRNTEPVIRSVSLVAGILTLPVLLTMCRQAGLSRLTSLFGLFVLAVHPAAIDLTKEFKPYALELLLHLLLLWLAFSFLRSPRTWRVALVGLAASLAAPFSWSIVVLYPGVFATVAVSALRRRSVPQLLGSLGGAAVTLGVVLLAYFSQQQGRDPNAGYWGEKYDIFYVGSGVPGQLLWLVDKTYEVASFPARLEAFWLDGWVVEVFVAAQVVCCLIGVIAIAAARRWEWAGLWLSPWVVTVGLNLLGLWPYGVFRTNLFLLAYALPVALVGLDGMRQWIASRPGGLPTAGKLVVPAYLSAFALVFLPVDIDFFAQGKGSGMAGNCYVHRAMQKVHEAERHEAPPPKPRRFLVDSHAGGAYSYYRDRHAVARELYRDFFQERYRRSRPYQPLEEAIDRHSERGFWLLACRADSAGELRRYALRRCPGADLVHDFRHGGVLLRCRP